VKSQKLTIFLADSSNNYIILFKQIITLLNLNCELFVCSDGETLLNYINSKILFPDYIFIDINLPKINGVNCLSQIKTKYPSNTFYVIMMENKLCQSTINTCYRYGATCFIDKLVDEEFLKNILNYCFNNLNQNVFEKEFVLNKIVAKQINMEMM